MEGCGCVKLQQEKASTRSSIKGGTWTTCPWSVQPQISFPLLCWRPCVCMCCCLYVSECVCKSCSNRRVGEDSLIQLSSVDSITNPLHLLKQPPQKTHPSPSSMCLCWESLGPGCASAFVSTPVIVPGPAPLPQPPPVPRTLIAAKTNSFQMFGKDPLFASGPNKIIFTSYPVVIRAERIEFMWHW